MKGPLCDCTRQPTPVTSWKEGSQASPEEIHFLLTSRSETGSLRQARKTFTVPSIKGFGSLISTEAMCNYTIPRLQTPFTSRKAESMGSPEEIHFLLASGSDQKPEACPMKTHFFLASRAFWQPLRYDRTSLGPSRHPLVCNLPH